MSIRGTLVACAFASASLATAAFAGDVYGGFGPGDTDTQVIGSDPETGGATPQDEQTMQSIQQQTQDQKDTYGGDGAQQDAVQQGDAAEEGDDGSEADDESGH